MKTLAAPASSKDGGNPTFLAIDASEAIAQNHPAYEAGEIPAGTFGTADRPEEEVKTITFSHHIVARKGLSEVEIAAFTRQFFSIRQQLLNEFPLAAKIETPDTDKDEAITVHPGTAAFVDFAYASAVAPPDRCALDAVALLVTTAYDVGTERALAAAHRALGNERLADLLPMVEPAALGSATRHDLEDVKKLSKQLREEGSTLTGTELSKPVELRRVSFADLLHLTDCALNTCDVYGNIMCFA